jgi:hypothetical protein
MTETEYDGGDWAEIEMRMDGMTEDQERARIAELRGLQLLTAKDCVELFALLKGISAFEAAEIVCDALESGELPSVSPKH